MAGNFRDDPKKASEAGRKGGEHSHGSQQSERSAPGQSRQEGESHTSGQRGGSREQHAEAGKQSHKNR